MIRELKDFGIELVGLIVVPIILACLCSAGIWYMMNRSVTYDFGNGARLVVPSGAVSIDKRKEGYGIVVQSGVNVVVYNDSGEWRTLTVSYRKPDYEILDSHAFEDLSPKSSKTFGADSERYEGMHVSVSDYAQKKRISIN